MSDGRKNNGGHSTKGRAGRKPKAEEQLLIERLTPLSDKAYYALETGLHNGSSWAVKMWFEYMYGKPKESVKWEDVTEPQMTKEEIQKELDRIKRARVKP